jgi:hypothetical protein
MPVSTNLLRTREEPVANFFFSPDVINLTWQHVYSRVVSSNQMRVSLSTRTD